MGVTACQNDVNFKSDEFGGNLASAFDEATAARRTMITLLPSTQPSSPSRCVNAAIRGRSPLIPDVLLSRSKRRSATTRKIDSDYSHASGSNRVSYN
jgi:hypothetical protein